MVIEQTIEIPASRRITFDIPSEFPAGERATVIVLAKDREEKTTPRQRTPQEAVEYCWGLGKRLGIRLTSDRLIEMRREDKALEEAKYRRMFHKDGGKD
ncbi:MAG: hypothetical protein LBG27_08825 [Spirochaetaceae bacterium]|jgi:hypothetical protein|nr:hypothetical protein [Spirochaetaceae bacterium]